MLKRTLPEKYFGWKNCNLRFLIAPQAFSEANIAVCSQFRVISININKIFLGEIFSGNPGKVHYPFYVVSHLAEAGNQTT